jgi:hypothetical protein
MEVPVVLKEVMEVPDTLKEVMEVPDTLREMTCFALKSQCHRTTSLALPLLPSFNFGSDPDCAVDFPSPFSKTQKDVTF